jgi:UMF1 family MFS transporter
MREGGAARAARETPAPSSEAQNGETVMPRRRLGAIVGWVLFDWACQPFYTLVTTFVFAPYFASALAANPVEGQALWGYATAAAGLALAALAPVLGSIADARGPKKPWIAACGLVFVLACAALLLSSSGLMMSRYVIRRAS